MAQTLGAKARSGFKVEVSLTGTGTVWTDISGAAATVTPSGGEQHIGEQNTASGSAPVVTGSNKVASRTLEVNCLYTEIAGEAWKVVAARYNGADKTIYLRYSPQGGAVGTQRFTCANDAGTAWLVPIVNCLPPEVDASTGDPLMFTFSVQTPKLVEATVT